jgi:hypothetical protein
MPNVYADANRHTPVSRLLQRNKVIFAVCVAPLLPIVMRHRHFWSGRGRDPSPRGIRLLLDSGPGDTSPCDIILVPVIVSERGPPPREVIGEVMGQLR